MRISQAPKTVIRLSRSSLQVARVSGSEINASETVEVDGFAWSDAWSGGLSSLDSNLAMCVQALGIPKNSPTLVMYDSPDATAMIVRLPRSAADPIRAAHLVLSETVRFPLSAGAVAVRPLAESQNADSGDRAWLAVADSESVMGTLHDWLGRAGLRMISAVPTQSVLAASTAQQATKDRTTRVVLHIGSDSATVIGSAGGSVLFSRNIDSGVKDMIESLQKGFDSESESGDQSLPSEVLFELGIPESRQQIDRFKAESGINPLPMLQPLLQRYIVEIKQSIRFSYQDLPEQPRELILSGPAAAIPGLAGLIGSQVDLPTDVCTRSAHFRLAEHTGPGTEIDIASSMNLRPLALLPERSREARSVSMGRVAIACGLVIAAAGIAVERDIARDRSQGLQADIAALAPVVSDADYQAQRVALAAEGSVGLSAIADDLVPHLESRTSLSLLLSTLVTSASDRVRLVEVRTGTDGSGPSATIEGILLGSDSGSDLRGYMNAIARSPVCRHVAVAWSRSTRIDGDRSLRFALDVELEELPAMLSLGWEPTE